MTFGERVLALRTEKGMTQDELALAVGYKSRSTIAKIESGERDPHQSMIAAIAKALDTTPAYLMGWDDVSINKNHDNNENTNLSYNPDIRRIERARKLMPSEKWNSMMKTVEAAFSEYFDDDYVDDDLDE